MEVGKETLKLVIWKMRRSCALVILKRVYAFFKEGGTSMLKEGLQGSMSK